MGQKGQHGRVVGYVAVGLTAVGALAACTTGGSTSTASSSSATSVSTRSSAEPAAESATLRTEVIAALTTNARAASVTVRASGAFTDTGALKLPIGNPRTITFKFTRGNLTILNATGPDTGPLRLDKATCAFSQAAVGTYRVLSGNSTGTYAGATGHGWYTFNSSGIAPKTPSGLCGTGGNVTPARERYTILFRGPLVLNPQH